MSIHVSISPKWYDDAVELVKNFDFELDHVYSNQNMNNAVFNCQFCGQRIMYVAIIKGRPKNIAVSHDIVKEIGCDCLGRVLGTQWTGYNSAINQLKDLKEIAAREARKAKYNIEYKQYIDFLNSLPEYMLEQNNFLKGMKELLTTGSQKFTENMEKWLKVQIDDPRTKFAKTHHINVDGQTKKIKELLLLIEEIDAGAIHDQKKSSYHFVNSILNYTLSKNGATQKQLESLNAVYTRYMSKKSKSVKNKLFTNTEPY